MTHANTTEQKPNQEIDMTVIYLLIILILCPFLFPLLIPLAILYLPNEENNA